MQAANQRPPTSRLRAPARLLPLTPRQPHPRQRNLRRRSPSTPTPGSSPRAVSTAGNSAPGQQANAPEQRPAAVADGKALPEQFDWRRQWYPLAPVTYLTQGKPSAYTVLGKQLVVWFHEPSQQWRAFEDRCPHRLAPLSEGRVDASSGNLQCTYHGWQFGDDGRCAAVPQADSPQQEAAVRASDRACVAAFPVRQEQGMLWVWMDASPDGALASLLRRPPLPADLLPPAGAGGQERPAGTLLGDWYMRDLPVSAEQLLENLVDPSHVHFAHAGVIGSPSSAGSIPLRLVAPLSAQGGFQLSMSQQWQGRGAQAPNGGGGTPAVTHFVPPGLIRLEFPAAGASFSMLFYAVPVGPGSCRIVAGYSTDALPPAVQAVLRSDALAPLLHAFQFVADLSNHQVLDGDAIHIVRQDETVRREGRRAYYMPAAADRGVTLLHRWLDELAGGGPQHYSAGPGAAGGQAPPPGPPLTRRAILDRYEQHTRQCPSCRRALSTVRGVRQALQMGSLSALTAAFTLALLQALAPRALAPPGARAAAASLPLLLGTAALVAAGARAALGRLEQQFVFVDYVHSDRR